MEKDITQNPRELQRNGVAANLDPYPGTADAHGGKLPDYNAPGPVKPKKGGPWILIATVVIVAALLAVGILPKLKQQKQLNTTAASIKQSHPIVEVVRPTFSATTDVIDLPGTFEAVEQTAINARATGYVDKVLVDIGSKVKAGQVLATISAPDTNQQTAQGRAQLLQSQAAVSQAVANLSAMEGALAQQQANLGHSRAAYLQAKAALDQNYAQLAQAQNQYNQQNQAVTEQVANKNLADVTNQRQQYLYQQGAIARQDADQAQATAQVNQAGLSLNQSALQASASNIKAYQANVLAGKANVSAAAQDIKVAQAEVATSVSNIKAAQAAIASAQATVAANQAALDRLVVLQNYENVTAPFDGVVTARNVDPGAYISAGSSTSTSSSVGSSVAGTGVSGGAASGSGSTGSSPSSSTSSSGSASGGGTPTGLFTVASIKRLRIFLNLPQNDADAIQVGQTAKITARSLPLKTFTGKVTQSAVALDPTSRTLVTEVQLDNPNGILRPGMFGDVKVTVPQQESILMVPDPAILTGPNGPQVLIVGQNKKIHYQDVTIGQDNGITLQILAGLKKTDRIVAAPNYNLTEGEIVQVQKKTKGKGKGRGTAGAS